MFVNFRMIFAVWLLYNIFVIKIMCSTKNSVDKSILTISCEDESEESNEISNINTDLKKLKIINCLIQHESFATFAKILKSVEWLTIEYLDETTINLEQKHFTGFQDLESLNIINDGNLTLGPDLLKEVNTKLNSISIKGNFIEFSNETFEYGENLQKLEITSRSIMKKLPPGIFQNLSSLNELLIYQISLESIEKDTFKGLENLRTLDISKNHLTYLDANVLDHLTGLKKISMGSNRFDELPEGLFNSTHNLEKFYLIFNEFDEFNQDKILKIPSKFLANLKNLSSVEIIAHVVTVPLDIFENSTSLESIHLSKFQVIPDTLFQNLKNLVLLNLSGNRISSINNALLKNLRKLKELYLSRNQIVNIDGYSFDNLNSIVEIDLSHNKLKYIYSIFHHLGHLETLNLSHNNIHTIYSFHMLNKLTRVDLSNNNIEVLDHTDFNNSNVSTVTIDLSSNKISTVDFASFADRKLANNNIIIFILKNNTLNCDCNLIHFIRHIQTSQRGFNFQLDKVFCKKPTDLSDKLLINILEIDLHCPLSDASSCPEKCTCRRRALDETLVVNCSNLNLTAVPLLPNAGALELNQTELYINNNMITELPSSIKDSGYNFVTKIYAANNLISQLNPYNMPKNIKEVDLRNNNFKTLDFGILVETKFINISNNPWECGCSDIFWIYLYYHHENVKDYGYLRCTNETLIELLTPGFCNETQSATLVVICVCLAVFGLLTGSLIGIFYKYKQHIKVWLYAHNMCLKFVTEDELDKGKKYDAFISYSHKDEEFITNHLLPELECELNPYKLCLHFRDWTVGEMIPNQITQSVMDSRRTIVVLSQNFIESVWGQMEFRTAHSQAMSEGRSRVILIIYGRIGHVKDLDHELSSYIKMNTYIEWGDTNFWSKLKYALPHQRR